MRTVGKSLPRTESLDKVTGAAKYAGDESAAGMLHAWIVNSTYAHAKIRRIDTSAAWRSPGVRAILTGEPYPILTGPSLADRPILARERVRYSGEPVAVVVADSEQEAKRAAERIRIEYEPLPVVNSPSQALSRDAPVLHEHLEKIRRYAQVFPVPGTNINNHVKIRKGNMERGWAASDVIIEADFAMPQSDHAAMETRTAQAEIKPDGRVCIYTTSQSPFAVREILHEAFRLSRDQVIVEVPLVGGGYGGKSAVQLELIAYLASRATGGRRVKVINTREQDFVASPVHIGLEARIRFGCTREGKLTAMQMTFLFDSGAYSDQSVIMARAAAEDCTGPYRVDNVHCDSLSLYTNHPFSTSFRGFGHPEMTFPVERGMDLLAKRLGMDPLELRARNAIVPGDTTPTQVPLDESTIGNLPECIRRVKEIIRWEEGRRIEAGPHKIRAKGVACLWKTSSSPVTASSAAAVTFNEDGTVNLHVGSVEMGQGNKTAMKQILAERMKMDPRRIHIKLGVNTEFSPYHWKTVASLSTIMAGRAVLAAADDAIAQLKETASRALKVAPVEVEIAGERAFLKTDPGTGMEIRDIAFGYKPEGGEAFGGQVIGRGNFIFKDLTEMDPETGAGKPGPQWTVAAQAVEVELDTRDYTYRLLRAATVIDAGRVINPGTAVGQIVGGMCMGLSFGSREHFVYSDTGIVLNRQFRSYKTIRYGEQPEYIVEFLQTPYGEGPYGARGIGEYGVIGMPAALANSLSAAAGVELNRLPLLPERIWRAAKEAGR